jgi:AmiR/NasT family two-component response regulator
MEETDVCNLTHTVLSVQQAIPHGCAAKNLAPSQRLTLGLHALAGTQSITGLADELGVSRKFVYQQAATAQTALDDAFVPSAATDDQVLFQLPVTKNWLRQFALSLTLICHSSYRGVVEFCRDLLDVHLSVGWVHTIVHAAIDKARLYNVEANLAKVAYAGLDEIYQHRQPVFVAADIESTYCFLLSREDHCDGDTWGIRLLEAQDRGLAPQAVVSDFGTAIHAGLKLAMPDIPHRGDVFHGLAEITEAVTFLEKRAYQMIAAHHQLQQQIDKMKKQGRPASVLSRKVVLADQAQVKAVDLADHIALLGRWLRYDVFAVSGLPYADRCTLFDFVLAELQVRAPLYPKQLDPICTMLQNHREQLLAFAAKLDQDLVSLAVQFEVSATVVRDMLDFEVLDDHQIKRWQKEARLRHQLRDRFCTLQKAVHDLAKHVVRASSVIENINSRLRNYFCLRREIGSDYLVLLQFFLNHRRFLRSERPERVGQSPAELLTGHSHPHWLEMLGYTRFSRN